jgi:acetylornithine deacetylase/succinyl-diaminopimelate desuccinylase-like protein
MRTPHSLKAHLERAVDRNRLLDTARRLVGVPSWTGQAGAALDELAAMLSADGFVVERTAAGHPSAPAVLVRFAGVLPGPTLQMNGHLDTVHLPFVAPAVTDGRLTGSGACDMKGGTACAVEALRVLRDTGLLSAGSVLLTAHDLHEAPWGFGQQLDQMIRNGYAGDAVLLPEPLTDYLPVVGRGAATWRVTIRRRGAPVHEVMRPHDEPNVIEAGAELVGRLGEFQDRLASRSDPHAGSESVFIGQIHSGEIYNQYPQECWLEGTRRWLPGVRREAVEREFRGLLDELAQETRTTITTEFHFIRDAFRLDPADDFVTAFQSAYRSMGGAPLPLGPKPFVDDGNSFYGLGPIPAITHGPRSGGQHTTEEWVVIDDMARVAALYALTAVVFCTKRSPESEAP